MHPVAKTSPDRRTGNWLKKAALGLCLLTLTPLWLTAQQAPTHATPAPNNNAIPSRQRTPLVQPIQPGMPNPAVQPGAVQPYPNQLTPVQPPPPSSGASAPGGRPGTTAPLSTPPGAPPVVAPSPANAPQLIYEGAPTTASVRSTMPGAETMQGGGEALPTAAPESPPIRLMVRQKLPEEIFATIREKTGVRVRAMGTVNSKKIDVLQPQEVPVETLLTQIANQNGWIWTSMKDGSYEMHDQQSYKEFTSRLTTQKVYQLHFIDAEELLKVVQPILSPEIAAAAADARSNKLIVTDLPGKLALIDSIIREYDVQVYTHVFEIKHASLDDIREQLDQVKSKSGEMFVNQLNRTIVVKDTFDKIKMMEQLVQILDRDVEMEVYNLLNIGLDGQFAEDFISKFIEPLKSNSESAVMEFNEATGKLYVRDVHSVHEKILQILHKVDVPRKQVRIEGEIVSVAVNHQLNLGTEWQYSHDLPGAINSNQGGLFSETKYNTIGLPLVTGGSNGLRVLEMTDNIRAELTAALTDTRTRLLLRPRITIANNEDGEFNVTRDEPVLQTYNYGNYNNFNNNYSQGQMTYRSGLQVRIHPTINNRGLVEMEIEFINSTPIIVDNIGNGVRGVGSTEESANTILIVPSGETRVIGGLISRDNTEGSSGIPYLSQVPWVGWLFGKKSNNNSMRNLMFFITPTIVEEQPLNDIIVEPINELAQISLKQTQKAATPPAPVNEIPPELRPYLKEVQPEALPLPETGQTTESAVGPVGATSDETPVSTTTTTPESGAALLSNEPFVDTAKAPAEFRMGGAVPAQGGKSVAGPSGVFGEGAPTGGAPRTAAGTTAPGAAAGTRPGAATTAKTPVATTPGTKTPPAATRGTRETTPRATRSTERSRYGSSQYRGSGPGMSPFGGGSQTLSRSRSDSGNTTDNE